MSALFIRVILFMTMLMLPRIAVLPEVQAAPKVLYLTFDDGPSERYTPEILDILRRAHVKVTFFVLGFRAEQYPQMVRRMRAEGHEIGNHGFYHEYILGKPDNWVRHDVERASQVIQKASGVNPVLYRPPGGLIDKHEMSVIQQAGHPVVFWTIDSKDWMATSNEEIITNVMSKVKPGAIILFHDGVSNSRHTAQALPTILAKCREQGYVFKVLPIHRTSLKTALVSTVPGTKAQ
ncbi:polysaccharide deacetylase family protein [Alicyclobacillus mengziensis]|uniref:Polysaccharide deacetylase family protein n=1 Tax=Alicyclobacillus mengziensis TaxID=2931921 RepID=A0A9X7VZ29_9BACL|nr:polysaccharide deacetylase family protein [Alicyclobacillus mengziensis]QSO47205.1 polysaccharide deacetylase family protein [Alicyclobacillus mengziensis]